MQRILKATSIFLLISILLISCEPVTSAVLSTPTLSAILATETKQPMPTESLALTAILTATSTLPRFMAGGPEKDISSYRLRSWSEADYEYVVDKIDNSYEMDDLESPFWILPDYHAVFQSERLLRYPDSSDQDSVLWDILLHKPDIPVLPGLGPEDDLMAVLISRLPTKRMTLIELKREIVNHGVYVPDVLIAKNLIGNGQDGLVIVMQLPDEWGSTGVYAIIPVENGYHVEQISEWRTSQFTAMGRYFSLNNIGDTNQNSLPEIVLEVVTSSSGMPGGQDMAIQHMEWSQADGKFVKNEFPVYWQSCDDPCQGDWEFKSVDSQDLLVTRSEWATRGDCPNLVTQTVSPWDGVQYVPGDVETFPPAEDLTPACRLAWAEAAVSLDKRVRNDELNQPGWKNDLAISIIEKGIQDWPASADELWGPGGRDYLKLRLGLLYDLRGEDKKAASLLQHLAKAPSVSEYDFMSRLAKMYLQFRRKEGKTIACLKIGDAYLEELQKITLEDYYDLDKSMRDFWGIVSWRENFSCSPDDMLPLDVESASLATPKSLMSWLKKLGIKVTQQETLDLHRDGSQDALILLDAYESDDPDAWAFFASPKGYQARYVYDFWPESESSKIEIVPLQADPGVPIYLIKVEDQLAIVRISQNLEIQTLVEEYGVQSYNVSEESGSLSVVIDVDDFDGKRLDTYLWDQGAQNFVLQANAFEFTQTRLEDDLYNKQDYGGVIASVDQFLSAAPAEPQLISQCESNECTYFPAWYVPYFRYLRGLAYEQLGQAELAKQAYYDLWRDFPNHLFGVAAGLKLEPVNP